ncbi:CBS domain-containing protein [Halomonas sp. Alg239-R46]|uniref:CBS domain-containing protein n=1 Tax=Halomonadaceae TaxID=28256 RepID=UPI00248ED905|nr:CBS domain-containing protein [Halomonas sp. Alg239-R46]
MSRSATSQVEWVSPETSLEELISLMERAHTRYPEIDDENASVGVVHLANLLKRIEAGHRDQPVPSVMRPAAVLPTLMRLPDALDQLVQKTNQMACVIDEYGGFTGVLTIVISP